jgi:hypothetical protein
MSLGNVLGAVAPIAAGYFTGGLSSGIMGLSAGTMSGIAGGALTGMGLAALSGDDLLMGGLSGGLGGYGGAGLAGANAAAKLSAQQAMGTGTFNAGNAAMAGYTGPTSMMSTLSSSGAGAGAGAGAGIGSLGTKTANAIANPMGRAGVSTNMLGSGSTPVANLDMSNAGGYQYTAQDFAGSGPTAKFGTDYGISDVAGQLGGGDPMAGYGKMALTAAGPLEAAFTPEYKPYETPEDEKYDPNRSLNLNMDTGINEALTKDSGLRLFAKGGTVQPQAGGGGGGGGGVNNLLRNMMEGTAQNMQTTGVPEGMSIADVIRAGRGYMPGPKGGVKLAQGGYLDGGMLPGDGMSDDVPANIDGEQEAALSQGEFVVPADVVSHLGNGSSDAGSKKLYAMMDKVRMARTGNKQQGKQINPERYMPA